MPQNNSKPVVIVTRTQPGADDFCARLKADGFDAYAVSALQVVPTPQPSKIDVSGIAALIITSAHALRVLQSYEAIETLKKMCLYTVGTGTSALAKQYGWHDVHTGPGDVKGLAALIKTNDQAGPFLHLAGKDLAKDTRETFRTLGPVTHWPVYRTIENVFDFQIVIKNVHDQKPVFVTLHSAKAAQIWQNAVQTYKDNPAWTRIIFLCLSPAVLESFGNNHNMQAYVAETPHENALCARLKSLV